MKNLIQRIKDLKELYAFLVIIVGLITGLFWQIHNDLNKNDEILDTIKTTQQMALKSVIWNEKIPLAERASACDVYLSAGYNSLTKKECQVIIDKGSEQGLF